jgi:hypothetical protein
MSWLGVFQPGTLNPEPLNIGNPDPDQPVGVKRNSLFIGDPSRIEQRFFEHGFLIGPDNISAGDDADQFGGVIG